MEPNSAYRTSALPDSGTGTPDGNKVWSWIALAFTAYWILFIAGAFLGRREFNFIGATVILAVLAWAVLERLWVKTDGVVIASIAAGIIPLMSMVMMDTPLSTEAVIKHLSLCIVMAVSRILCLPVACKAKVRWVLVVQILIVLAVCLAVDRGNEWDGGTRSAGLFANPNNLALIPFLLFFLVDQAKDPLIIRLGVHALTVVVLAITGTSGAVIAYAIGLAIHARAHMPRAWRTPVYSLVAAGSVAVVLFLAAQGETLLPETRLTNQISVLRTQFGNVVNGGEVAYYDQERVLGPGAASGIWRLVHWRRTLRTYGEGTVAQQLFGFGLGSSPVILGKLPHNEYLRMLFEQGFVGLVLFLYAWFQVIRTSPSSVRFVGIVIAIYSFSENNLDNFPFMSLFILCLSATGVAVSRRMSGMVAARRVSLAA